MFQVYILFSESIHTFYIGQTQDLENRLAEHNSGETKSAHAGRPWKLTWSIPVATRSEAMKLEKKIKA